MFRDVLSDKTRIRVTDQEVGHHCKTLAKAITRDFRPDLVVAIDTGGSIPGELIGQCLGLPVVHIVIRRDIKMIRRYGLDPVPLRWIMSLYHHYLFQTAKPIISTSLPVNVSGKRVLIADDAMHTGATVDVAISYLKKGGVTDVKVASLSYVGVRMPDYSVLPRGNYCFPWSRDYK